MKKVVLALLCVVLSVSMLGCGGTGGTSQSSKTYSVGESVEHDGVTFTLNEFAFAKKTDNDTYNPNKIEKASWVPNDGYIFGYLNYKIDNKGEDTFSHFTDFNLYIEYDGTYSYGKEMTDYKVSCTEFDKYNKDVDPLMNKTYHHIISNCASAVTDGGDIKVFVKIHSKTFVYEISGSAIEVLEGSDGIERKPVGAEEQSRVNNAMAGYYFLFDRGNNLEAEYTFNHGTTTVTNYVNGNELSTLSGTYQVYEGIISADYGMGSTVDFSYEFTSEGILLTILD